MDMLAVAKDGCCSCCSTLSMLFDKGRGADAICLIRLICGQLKEGGRMQVAGAVVSLLGGCTSQRLVLHGHASGGERWLLFMLFNVVDVV